MSVEIITKQRRLPTRGEVLVDVGQQVQPETVVAKGVVPNPELHDLKLFTQLRVEPEMVKDYMTKAEGEQVARDEVIAVSRSFFTRQTRVSRSPVDGFIERVSTVNGRVYIRGNPLDVIVSAYLPGAIKEVIPEAGAVVETSGIRLEGAFGIGGEAYGGIILASEDSDTPLSADNILPEHQGKVIVGGSIVSLDALRDAVNVGAKGVIVGGVDQKDLTYFLGYEIGVPVTGNEQTGLTLIMTEGFGINPMDEALFETLRGYSGRMACINGATQLRSRSIRPEIILPSP
jgi:hypothetical protein